MAALVREAGGLYIADEVQSGFGRTGAHLWGYQRHPGLVPDLVTMGKPMGNGLPIAGLVARQPVLAEFGQRARYFNTFGGNPVCVAAASAVLDVLADEDLPGNARSTGEYLRSALARSGCGQRGAGGRARGGAVRRGGRGRRRRPVCRRPSWRRRSSTGCARAGC